MVWEINDMEPGKLATWNNHLWRHQKGLFMLCTILSIIWKSLKSILQSYLGQHILKWSLLCMWNNFIIDWHLYINSKLYKTIQFSTNNSIIFSHELNGSCCHTHRKYWSITLTWQHEVLTRTNSSVLIVNWSSVQNCRDCYIISNININRVDGRHQLDSVQTFHHYLLF